MNEKFENALRAMAVADGIGDPFEFDVGFDPQEVINLLKSTETISFTDDTQMSLFMFESLSKLSMYPTDKEVFERLVEAYIGWHATQTESMSRVVRDPGTLLDMEAMYQQRAPGNTCLSAIADIRKNKLPNNDSCGCGSVMRLLPMAHLYTKYPKEDVDRWAKISGYITHQHEENEIAIQLYMDIVYFLLFDVITKEAYEQIEEIMNASEIAQLGSGWTALECVRMAIWATMFAVDYEDLVTLAVAHDGDSDSVAAVAASMYALSTEYDNSQLTHLYSRLEEAPVVEYIISKM